MNEDKDEANHLSRGRALKSALRPQAAKNALLCLLSHLIVIIIIMTRHIMHESVTIVTSLTSASLTWLDMWVAKPSN